MLLAALEPGKEMAIANFSLAIFCLFTLGLPLLLITRGDKTEANRHFLAKAVNPWSKDANEVELEPVNLNEFKTSKMDSNLEVVTENKGEGTTEFREVVTLEGKRSEESDDSISQSLTTRDEILAA
tara:strand:- start:521 stop:898 length:378 start_codon:yes stop_codon:yes gene_type:complete